MSNPTHEFIIITYDRVFPITREQRNILFAAMDAGIKYFDIKGGRVMMSQIKEIAPTYYK